MADDRMGLADVLQLWLRGGSNTNLRSLLGLVHRTARGRSAAGNGPLEIKDAPLTCLDAPSPPRNLLALLFDE